MNKAKKLTKQDVLLGILNGRVAIVLAVLIIYFSFKTNNFLTIGTLKTVIKHTALYGLIGLGMTVVIMTGGINLSIGRLAALAGMLAGIMLEYGIVINPLGITIYFSSFEIIVICCIVGGLFGAFSGLLINKFGLVPYIATLGVQYICSGLANISLGGGTAANLQGTAALRNTGFPLLGTGKILGLEISIWIFLVIAVLFWYISTKTPLGRQILAIGGNERAAAYSGIRVARVKYFVHTSIGVLSAMAGLIMTAQLQTAHPATGTGWESIVISAVVLGGVSMKGGIGSITGGILGMVVIVTLTDGLIMMGVSSYWQEFIKGGVIIFAVIVDQMQQKLQRKISFQMRNDPKDSNAAEVSA